jgi:hypothetical protein
MLGKKSLYDAQHPARQKAIVIMELIAEKLGKPRMFDCRNSDNTRWYDFEDRITMIIAGKE